MEMKKYEEGYEKLLTYKQGMEIYQRTKRFTAANLERIRDSRLIGHMNDSARSVPSNIREGAKRGNTKAYLEFLGFARGSLEELKGDYEELKRELKEGERWSNKDKEGKIRIEKDKEGRVRIEKDKEGRVRIEKDKEGNRGIEKYGERKSSGNSSSGNSGSGGPGSGSSGFDNSGFGNSSSAGRGAPYVSLSIPINPYSSLSVIAKEIEDILTLIYGEDCMLGRQVRGLENKAVENKDLPQNQLIKRSWNNARAADDRFWKLARERFGIEKDEKGIIRQNKDREG